MQALTSMGSFSDAHEPIIIPIIARNLQRLILPQQSLVWAVLHPQDDASRLTYSLAATFLGRMCLSGEIHDLNNEQMEILRRATRLYRQAHTVIDNGTSTFYGTEENSYVDPRGWQAVVRQDAYQTLIVIHGFNLETSEEISLPTGPFDPRIVGTLSPSFIKATLENGRFQITLPPGCHGGAWLISS
jgi:alpha-galactosidase